MSNVAKLVAMESILEQMTGELVLDVQNGKLGMNEQLMVCLEALVDATRKTQIVREIMEAEQGGYARLDTDMAEVGPYRYKLAS